LERKKEANSAFFYDLVVDECEKLVYILWVDATSRKNYNHFGDLVSVDATYSTNQYNMIFVSFTEVNHHMQSVFFGGASMIAAIRFIFPDTIHRFYMWHIMEKMSEKVGFPTNKDKQFWADLNECVWVPKLKRNLKCRGMLS
jgi:zinc finger SWIM domain-containing protein 3